MLVSISHGKTTPLIIPGALLVNAKIHPAPLSPCIPPPTSPHIMRAGKCVVDIVASMRLYNNLVFAEAFLKPALPLVTIARVTVLL
jgi:hypothetical protein